MWPPAVADSAARRQGLALDEGFFQDLGLSMKPSDYFHRQVFATARSDRELRAFLHAVENTGTRVSIVSYTANPIAQLSLSEVTTASLAPGGLHHFAIGNPGGLAERLTGLPFIEVTEIEGMQLSASNQLKGKIVELEWGADTNRFHPGATGPLPFTRPRGVVAVFAGAFRSWHGAIHLARAIRLLRERGRADSDRDLVHDQCSSDRTQCGSERGTRRSGCSSSNFGGVSFGLPPSALWTRTISDCRLRTIAVV